VQDRHELGQSGAAEQRMVQTAEVHHLELDRLTAEIVFLSEQHLQLDPSHRCTREPRHDVVEG
jgi:hypothetical protein